MKQKGYGTIKATSGSLHEFSDDGNHTFRIHKPQGSRSMPQNDIKRIREQIL